MNIPRLSAEDTQLIVIDVQERLMPTMAFGEALVANTVALLHMANALEIPALVTEQYPQGLGPTVELVREAVPSGTPIFPKTRFSALTTDVAARLEASGRRSVLVCGVEAHICVLQTVLDLQTSGYQAFVCTDAVSAGQAAQIPPAERRMERAGAVPTGVLSALYELMGDKTHPRFRDGLRIAKAVQG